MIFGYTRNSTDAQEMSQSVQLEAIRRYCLYKHGRMADKVFSDEGVSGKTPLAQRPQGALLTVALEPGDVVVAAKVDRAFRSFRDLVLTLEEWDDKEVGAVFLDIDCDTTTAVGKALLRMMGTFAELERSRIAERTREANERRRAQGLPTNGNVPFGKKIVRLPGSGKKVKADEPYERELAGKVIDFKSRGYTYRQIADYFGRVGLTDPRTGKVPGHLALWRWARAELQARREESAKGGANV